MTDKIVERTVYPLRRIIAETARRKTEKKIKWAVVGIGNMGKTFLRALSLCKDAEISCVCSGNPEKAEKYAKKYHCIAYSDYSEMLAEADADVIYLAVPNECHYEYSKKALCSKRAVLCEKPICYTVCQLEELIKIAEENNVFFAEGMWSFCLPTYRKAIEWLKSEGLGHIKRIDASIQKPESEALHENYGGVLMDYGVYVIAFAVLFAGGDLKVENAVRTDRTDGTDKSWEIDLICGDVICHLLISSDTDGKRDAQIIAEKGIITFAPQFNRSNKVTLIKDDGDTKIFQNKYICGGFEYEIAEVNRCIKENKTTSKILSPENTVKTTYIMEKLKKV